MLLEKLASEGKCTKYRSTVSGTAIARVPGVFKDYYKDAIEIWKAETPRGQQYIIIYHDTAEDGHVFSI